MSKERALLRLDDQYGTGAVLTDLAGFACVTRGKEYTILDHPLVQARLHLPPDQVQQRPESQTVRSLYDCPEVPVGTEAVLCRVVVATHPEGKKKSPVGVTRDGVVYELFFTMLPQAGFTACDVVELYLHRGAFEPALADEDTEQDPDRWCSHSAWGQECWQVVSQWVWNLRLELGHRLDPTPVRTTEFAPALSPPREQAATHPPSSPPTAGYGPPTSATSWKTGRFTGADFPLQPDGTLRCPAGKPLHPQEQRRETDGSLRVAYAASIRHCRPCPLREQCQWHGSATAKPRQVSVRLASAPGGSCTAAVAGLESQRTPARLSTARAPSTHRGRHPVETFCCFAHHRRGDPFSRAACSRSALLADAPDSQCAEDGGKSSHHQTVRDSRAVCGMDWPHSRLTRALPISSRGSLENHSGSLVQWREH